MLSTFIRVGNITNGSETLDKLAFKLTLTLVLHKISKYTATNLARTITAALVCHIFIDPLLIELMLARLCHPSQIGTKSPNRGFPNSGRGQ